MHTAHIEPTFDSWREMARSLLAANLPPATVLWQDDPSAPSLFVNEESPPAPPDPNSTKSVPRAFIDLAIPAAAHTDPRRWALLYQLLWRLTRGERHLLAKATDPEVRLARQWASQVGREIHKMHAFVRFQPAGVHPQSGREQFIAWFEPTFRIVRLAAPFFERRYHNLNWSILTPSECAHWNGSELTFTPGVSHSPDADPDALGDLWRTYYKAIFNPARVKTKAMQAEMPKKYWHNLPEASLIPGLIAQSRTRTGAMLHTTPSQPKPTPLTPYIKQIHQKNKNDQSSSDFQVSNSPPDA